MAYLKSPDARESGSRRHFSARAPSWPAVTSKAVPFAPGSQIIPGLVKAVQIKGPHSRPLGVPSSPSGESSLLYIGDARASLPSCPFRSRTGPSPSTAMLPLPKRAALRFLPGAAGTKQRIYAVHFPFPGLGTIERKGDGVRLGRGIAPTAGVLRGCRTPAPSAPPRLPAAQETHWVASDNLSAAAESCQRIFDFKARVFPSTTNLPFPW